MATARPGEQRTPRGGLLETLRSCLATGVALLKTRIEIISTELEEAKLHFEEMVLLAVVSIFCLSFGLLLLTLFVVVLFWETYRWQVLGAFALLYLGSGIAAALALRKKAKGKPKLFASTMEELEKDYSNLSIGKS